MLISYDGAGLNTEQYIVGRCILLVYVMNVIVATRGMRCFTDGARPSNLPSLPHSMVLNFKIELLSRNVLVEQAY